MLEHCFLAWRLLRTHFPPAIAILNSAHRGRVKVPYKRE